MIERDLSNKRNTTEVFIVRAEKDRTSIPIYDDNKYIPLSTEQLFIGQGHVAPVLGSEAFSLSDFVLIKGKKSPGDTVEKVHAELIRSLGLTENEVFIVEEDTWPKLSPVLVGQVPWKDLIAREAFTTNRLAQFYLLDALEQELRQADLGIELIWLSYRDDNEKYLTRMKRILANALAVDAFLQAAKKAELPFDEIGPEEYRKTFEEILAVGVPREIDAALEHLLLREQIEKAIQKYVGPLKGINKGLRRLLGLKKGKKRVAYRFLKQIDKPIENWEVADFQEYLKFTE